jgi:hypothetical protein
MIDQRELIQALARSTPDECREIGKLFLSMADVPRDVHWKAGFSEKLAMFPEPPETSIAIQMGKARARVTAENDALRAAGWHPIQMRAELEARGYTGAAAPN